MNERHEWVKWVLTAAAALSIWVTAPVVQAQVGSAPPASEQAVPDQAAPGHAAAEPGADQGQPLPWQLGPTHVELGHDLALDLSERHMFLPKEAAAQVLERMGSFYHDNLLGLAASQDESADWFVVIRYEAEGYVKDDEKIDADELLSALREGNELANEERTQRGFKPLALDGWAEPPRYDAALHHLVWALTVSDSDGKSVNFNTRVLGRRGFASLNLVTDPTKLEAFKPEAAALLAGTRFANGARYEDFNASSDKTAEYGLAGLIAAGAGLGASKLVKIGLLAKSWKVLLGVLFAGKKLIVLALFVAAAFVKKLLSGRGKGETPASPG